MDGNRIKHLFVANKKGLIIDHPKSASAEDYDVMRQLFIREAGIRDKETYVRGYTMPHLEYAGNVPYAWGLASAEGAWFDVLHMPYNSNEEVKEARNRIRRESDVVKMETTTVETLLPAASLEALKYKHRHQPVPGMATAQ